MIASNATAPEKGRFSSKRPGELAVRAVLIMASMLRTRGGPKKNRPKKPASSMAAAERS